MSRIHMRHTLNSLLKLQSNLQFSVSSLAKKANGNSIHVKICTSEI